MTSTSISLAINYLGNLLPFSINNAGDVVGYHDAAQHLPDSVHEGAYYWSQGTLDQLLPLPAGTGVKALHVNASGLIVGTSYASNDFGAGSSTAVYWTSGSAQPVSLGWLPGDLASEAFADNDASQIVGLSYSSSDSYHGFLWQNGKMNDLGSLGGSQVLPQSINDQTQIVGEATIANGNTHAFLWQSNIMTDLGTLPGGATSVALGINTSGVIAGFSTDASGNDRAVYWSEGQIHKLPVFSGEISSIVLGINDQGWMVGSASPESSNGIFLAVL